MEKISVSLPEGLVREMDEAVREAVELASN